MPWFQKIPEFWICQGYTRFWIRNFLIDVLQYSEYVLDSEYATVLNLLGLHKAVNKIFYQRCLTGFWICFEFWIYSVTQDRLENSPPYMFGRFLIISWALNMLGPEYARIVNMPRFCVNCILNILNILNVLSSEYAKVLNVSAV